MKDLNQVQYRYALSKEEEKEQENHEHLGTKSNWWFIAGVAGYGGTG